MGVFTSLTRMWITRSFKGFDFSNTYENYLDYDDCKKLGLYVHIPFCEDICKFCPYCKVKYNKEKMDRYIDYLIAEIDFVTRGHKKKKVTSLYFGGGTPVLAIDRLEDVLNELREHFDITEGIGIELHPSNVTRDNLQRLKDMGFTKISIGIQSFQDKFLNILGRKNNDFESMFTLLKEFDFETIAMDFIFALPNQGFEDLKADIDTAFSNGANHIAMYPFIDFGFLKGNIKELSKNEKRSLLDRITNYCKSKGYVRDSIWTFSKNGRSSYSSMTRENFLGFGCSATTVLDDIFKINTFNISSYQERLGENNLPTSLTLNFTKRQRMVYYLFWIMYSTKLDPRDFYDFFGEDLKRYYGMELKIGKMLGFLEEKDGVYYLTDKGCFYYHHYEKYYTYDYINNMWGKMSKVAFPEELNIR